MNASPTKYTRLDLAVGTFVLAGLFALTFLAVRIGAGNSVGGASTTYRASFSNLGGLAPGASVMISGVIVGRVDKVEIDDRFRAIATLRVRADLKLAEDTAAGIRSSGLIGEKFIALTPGGGDALLKTDELITDTESAVDLESLISRFAFGGVKSGDTPDKK
ncbi:ABC transporter substrate-binding protein [Verrucomicrobia bacterium IMCC26134]|jgi:phospholipid/cholesterol/gamma-HCH transport system substrate-binding protein|nr:ABC transporter substrate-binding protein [Verrucomicrobia bacterium IMCC26134]